jgi:hypothetical protein
MNALKKILVVTAALATFGATGLASTQASACWHSLPSYEAHESDGDCIRYTPIYDCWGNCIGHRAVSVCD